MRHYSVQFATLYMQMYRSDPMHAIHVGSWHSSKSVLPDAADSPHQCEEV